jgi:hypothetical protein
MAFTVDLPWITLDQQFQPRRPIAERVAVHHLRAPPRQSCEIYGSSGMGGRVQGLRRFVPFASEPGQGGQVDW